jgi:hypothetical protein
MDDIEAIKQLKARYFRLMDTKDWDAWGQVFAEDCEMVVDSRPGSAAGDVMAITGRKTIVEMVRSQVGPAVTVHHGHMPEIDLTSSDTAKGIWAMEDVVELPGERMLHGFGHYHETYVKTPEGWKIARLHLTRLRVVRTGF